MLRRSSLKVSPASKVPGEKLRPFGSMDPNETQRPPCYIGSLRGHKTIGLPRACQPTATPVARDPGFPSRRVSEGT
jgi:hypothetical protein